MRAKCCDSRINHQREVVKLDKPNVYGIYHPETQTVLTHEAEYACKCGKTVIIVEGTVKKKVLDGCFIKDME